LDTCGALRGGHFGVAAQGEGDVLFYCERIVEGGVLEEETHLLSELVHFFEIGGGDFLALNVDGAGVGLLQTDDQAEQDAFAGAAATEDCYGLAAVDF
jgi:hypothetical protein